MTSACADRSEAETARGLNDLGLRRPERSGDIEPFEARMCLETKKKEHPSDVPFSLFQERETGIEPATPSLARRCSTAEPLAHVIYVTSII